MAIASAKKLDLFPDEQFIQDALRSGRCTKQELSMKVLRDPDTAYQARELHLNLDHVRWLEGVARENDGKLQWVVVFMAMVGKVARYILADGFHRHAALTNMRAKSIRAYVVACSPEDLEHEARLFATTCNRKNCLPRNKEDIKKAVEMLFADPECWPWSDSRIADHCGIASRSVSRYRTAYSIKAGVPVPRFVVTSSGMNYPYGETLKTYIGKRMRGASITFQSKVNGKTFNLGSEKVKAEEKKRAITDQIESTKRLISSTPSLMFYLSRKGVQFEVCRTLKIPKTYHYYGVIFTPMSYKSSDSLLAAIGRLCLTKHCLGGNPSRLVVLCVPEDVAPLVATTAREMGIEFLTPDQLVESLKGQSTKEDSGRDLE